MKIIIAQPMNQTGSGNHIDKVQPSDQDQHARHEQDDDEVGEKVAEDAGHFASLSLMASSA